MHDVSWQGGFYLLGYRLVRYLYISSEFLTVMLLEDAMVGTWLLGVDKVNKKQ